MAVTKDFKTRCFKLADVVQFGDKAVKTVFYKTDATSGSVWGIRPGQEVAAHEHPEGDDFWVCVQGEGVFFPAPGEEVPVAKGDLIISAKGMCHGLRNTGTEDFIFVSVVAPVPPGYKAL
ncbi:cupin domain-containing protein [Mitsuokella sp. oral taxon 131]|uniref:cupin domain-containing protein n=1 Tax=Mitsuokella sp. oral taxon 131 TaxID=1321780 RepID=UPI0003AE56A3|nr:cupin domain-containing protein [Mitsuokella sp. oral taxon 131]ERL25371.1 cupin domain protein [Mitsuokella sp. oral taxon 131 str. W9106]